MTHDDFSRYSVAAPEYDELAAQYAELHRQFDTDDNSQWISAVEIWDRLRRQLYEWQAVTETLSGRFK